jgi:hypothetical protein
VWSSKFLLNALLPPQALTETRLTGIRRILFPFLDPSEIEHDRKTHAAHLLHFGFTEDTGGEANGTLFLRRE